jgi:hypothetical protein
VIANTATDVAGVATAEMMSGSVTAVNPFTTAQGGISYSLYTFTGVKPGDALKLDENFGQTATNVMITAPEDTDPNTASYVFGTPCGVMPVTSPGSGATPTASMYLYGECATTTDFLVYSLDGNDNVLHYFFVKDQAVTATIDFTAKTWAAPTTKTYEITNTGVFSDEYGVAQKLASARGEVGSLTPTSTGTGTFTLDVPAFNQALSIIETTGYMSGIAEHRILEWGPVNGAQYTLDAGSKVLVDMTAAPTFDPTTHTLSWTEGASGLAPDFSLASVSNFREPSTYTEWWIAGPHTSASLVFPTLPADVFDFNIATGDSTNISFMILAKIPGGYDAVRSNVFTSGGETDLISTPTGTLSGELYQNLQLRPVPKTSPKMIKRALSGRRM